VVDDLKSGDHRRALTALRDILADQIALCEPSVVAQVAARLQSVLAELAALPTESKLSTVDQLRAKRDSRRAS
jgi:hypothetical protein